MGLNVSDWKRIGWTALQAGLAVVILNVTGWLNGASWDWKAVGVAALAAVLSAVKNFALSDDNQIK